MAEQDFSQDGEQAAIVEWAAGRLGSFLELGAYDGVSYSNTRALALRGWPGVAVEPAPDAYARLKQACAGLPVECWNAACVVDPPASGTLELRWSRGQPFSSLVHDVPAGEWATVPALSLGWLWQYFANAFDPPWLISLDTEGTTIGLLAALLQKLPAVGSTCLVVEAHENVADERPVARLLLAAHGFRTLFENPVNVIAARS